jgi:hypothetical protein
MKPGDTEQNLREIDAMTQEEIARLWRFAPSGHPAFVSGSLENKRITERFAQLGGMTPEISKRIGWGKC